MRVVLSSLSFLGKLRGHVGTLSYETTSNTTTTTTTNSSSSIIDPNLLQPIAAYLSFEEEEEEKTNVKWKERKDERNVSKMARNFASFHFSIAIQSYIHFLSIYPYLFIYIYIFFLFPIFILTYLIFSKIECNKNQTNNR